MPLPIPAALSGIAASDLDRIAVTTLSHGRVCVDAQWIESIDPPTLSDDGRFLSFGWLGYEEYGHKLVDRADSGTVVDTGVAPVSSPSGKLIAALEYSESGFGSLNGLGVWRVSDKPLTPMAVQPLPEGYTEWRFDGWKGDACIDISAIAFGNLPQDDADEGKGKRDRFAAQAGTDGWTIVNAPSGCERR